MIKKGEPSARALARITGQCISMSKAVIPAKLLLRNLYKLLRQRKYWQDILILDQGCLKDLGCWQTVLKSWNGCAFCPKGIEVQLTTDASSIGWGGFIPGRQVQELWTNSFYYENSNLREMAAVLFSMIAFRKVYRAK